MTAEDDAMPDASNEPLRTCGPRRDLRCRGLHSPRFANLRPPCTYSAAPRHQRTKPPAKPKLDPFIAIIDAILKTDAEAPKKQRYTAKRIFERIQDGHGYDGGDTIVADYVREARRRTATGP